MKAASPITRDEIKAHLDENRACLILDVLVPEAYAIAHLPGAKNACVYDITFIDTVCKLAPDRQTKIILYGSGPRNLASTTAAGKLLNAGYANVCDYRGGLEDWRSGMLPLEGLQPETASTHETVADGIYSLNIADSKIEWTGRNFTGSHTGTLKLLNGTIHVKDGHASDGAFTIDMDSIEDRDLPDSGMRQMLISHLKSDDFFDVRNFPTAEFRLSHITPLSDAPEGSANMKIRGELTLKGTSQEIEFTATIASASGGILAAEAHFDIDRTRWKVLYGSGKFYEKLGKHLVYDNVTIGLKLITQAAK